MNRPGRSSDRISLTGSDVEVGDRLPDLSIPLTRTLIVATALATRDYQEVHHDPDIARERGGADVFMNILTSQGYVGRYVTDWCGPNAILRRIAIKLGAQNYPGDTMVMTGTVVAKRPFDTGCDLDIAVKAANSRGEHLGGTVTVTLPAGDPLR